MSDLYLREVFTQPLIRSCLRRVTYEGEKKWIKVEAGDILLKYDEWIDAGAFLVKKVSRYASRRRAIQALAPAAEPENPETKEPVLPVLPDLESVVPPMEVESLGSPQKEPAGENEDMEELEASLREMLEVPVPGTSELITLPSVEKTAPASQQPPSERNRCKLCAQGHFVANCPQFRAFSPDKRHQWVTQRYLCTNCLGSHNVLQCRNSKTCTHCEEKHHSMLHGATALTTTKSVPRKNTTSTPLQLVAQTYKQQDETSSTGADATHLKRLITSNHFTSISTTVDINDVELSSHSAALNSVQINHSHDISRAISRPSVLLATAKAILNYADDNHQIIRLLIDPGSELTLISRTIVNNCQLDIISSQIPIVGVGSVLSGSTSGAVNISLTSLHSDDSVIISVHILNKLTAKLPAVSIKKHSWNHLNNLQLADSDYFKYDGIDLLIGADCYGKIIKLGVQTGSLGDPVALKTIFGWSILGPVSSQSQQSPSRSHHIISNDQLHESIVKFWQLEEVPSHLNESLTVEEAECESHFQSTHSRDHTGRYTVRLPFKSSSQQFGHSMHIASKCLNRLIKNISQKTEFNHFYRDFLTEYEAMGHMQKVPDSYQSSHITYYLPHHGVLREESTTTKLRVVFNGSSNTTSGISLNDTLHTGPKLQSDIFDVLLYVRGHLFVFTTDITKMFRQINVHPDDWDYQRILWVDDDNQPQSYHLTTVTYGTRPAPYLAGHVLKQLIIDEGDEYSQAVEPFEKGSYVDDICRGADNVNHLNNIASQVEAICLAGCFPLAKWKSNHPQFSKLSSSNISNSHEFNESTSKVLGLSWKCQPDHLTFTGHTSQKAAITKRSILSETAQLFDPLGLISPVVIKAKILMQDLWLEKIEWDDSLSPEIIHRWKKFRDELPELSQLKIPRWLNISSDTSNIEIHGFSDASQHAMVAAVYIKTHHHLTPAKITLTVPRTPRAAQLVIVFTKTMDVAMLRKWNSLRLSRDNDQTLKEAWTFPLIPPELFQTAIELITETAEQIEGQHENVVIQQQQQQQQRRRHQVRDISSRTIINRLRETGLHARHPNHVPLLTLELEAMDKCFIHQRVSFQTPW
ncbi:uncharacterized protein LOC130666897 [Microplitis mediator]|uniref:uncharacterized protein LOC130666897 n=1 Tax=Microplitis mediator TaxID=375433 RepID=UPI002553417B|nr:uncharacterized protein LOC130666897 [Microplitis mediator]